MFREQTDEQRSYVLRVKEVFSQLQVVRNTFASHWEEVAELILPNSRNTFMYGSFNWQGQKKTDRQVDATGMMALQRFSAICDSLLTPRNMFWHSLEADDENLKKDRNVRLWFEQATKILFKQRYMPTANFSGQNIQNYEGLGAFGNMAMFIDALDPKHGIGLRYKAIPLGEIFVQENHQGIVDGFVRWFRMTARQVRQKWPDNFPPALQPALEQGSEVPFDILHYVHPNDDYDPERIDYKGMPYRSCYVSVTGEWLLEEGGFNTFPLAFSRYAMAPGEVYGRSPAMMVLPALKTLNAQKRVFLKQGHRAADPVLLTADDGLLDISLKPGAINKGGVSTDGKLLVQTLPTGSVQINKEMMDEERALINDAFLVSLFQILTETPTMTATEVIERTNEKGILLAPTVGKQQSEYLGPLIHRELDVLSSLGLLPPMPPLLREAKGAYHVSYTSPLSRAMRAQEASGFMRTLETVLNVVNATQDPSHMDVFDLDTALPAIAEINAVPVSWMSDAARINSIRQARAQQAQIQQQIQAAPAAASMVKAGVDAKKAGVAK